ncbi:MAG: ATP-binding cassette domain-containing protein [Planctomycetes bacterium]|nr:ATP-binding cassette domain-containing protein [Planctomycetota bacterium]
MSEPHDHDHGSHHAPSLSPPRRYIALLRADLGDLKLVLLFAVLSSVLYLAVPVTIDAFLSNVMFGTIMQPLIVLTTALLGSLLFLALLQALQFYAVEIIQRRIFVRVAGEFAWRLARLKREAIDALYPPSLVNRFLDVAIVQKKTVSLLNYTVSTMLTTLVGMFVLGLFHPTMLGFALVLLLGLLVVVVLLGRGGVRTAIAESVSKYDVVDWLEEIVRHDTIFATRTGAELARSRVDRHCERYLEHRSKHFRILFRQVLGGLFLQIFAATAVLGVGGLLVLDQQLTVGQLVASELIVSGLVANVSKIGGLLESWYDICASADKVGHVLDLELERSGGEPAPSTRSGLAYEARGLGYAFARGPRVLQELDLRIAHGECLALLAPPGGGISTLFDLLFGFREPQAGYLLYNGLDLRQLDLVSLREQVELVRHPEIAEGSIIENLRLTRPDLSAEAAWAALDIVELKEDVLAMPQGIDTRLQSGGPTLSTGQALRLTLARAIAREPRVLLLDDVLDRLDRELRVRIARRLLAPELPWTVIVSTDLSEIADLCQRAIRVPEGERIESSRAATAES